MLVNVPQRLNLRGRQQAYVIVGVALHEVGIEHHESKSRSLEANFLRDPFRCTGPAPDRPEHSVNIAQAPIGSP